MALAGAASSPHRSVLPAGSSTAGLAKLPHVTLAFWIMKIAATTLGETAATCSR